MDAGGECDTKVKATGLIDFMEKQEESMIAHRATVVISARKQQQWLRISSAITVDVSRSASARLTSITAEVVIFGVSCNNVGGRAGLGS